MKSFWTFITTTAAFIAIHVIYPFAILYIGYTSDEYKDDCKRIYNDWLDANREREDGTNNPY